jgi:hypothetical protein
MCVKFLKKKLRDVLLDGVSSRNGSAKEQSQRLLTPKNPWPVFRRPIRPITVLGASCPKNEKTNIFGQK